MREDVMALEPTTMIFDGTCVLCNRATAFVLAHEKDPHLHFVAVRSERGKQLADAHGLSEDDMDRSFVVIHRGQLYKRSAAAFLLMKHLRAPYRWLQVLRVFPRALGDALYDVVARNRYRWFGKQDHCTLPPEGQRDRFWDDRAPPD